MNNATRYAKIIEKIFLSRFKSGDEEVDFSRDELIKAARELQIDLPKNLGDILYSFRYRVQLPESIRNLAPEGKEWIIRPAGRGLYRFMATHQGHVLPRPDLKETKIPDATPGLIGMYALSDEQALLAKLRYNRLIDIFTGVACYSLQNHLRTTAPGIGQVETDEVYIGVDHRGVHYVFPVQAKGGRDRLSVVQIEQDIAVCESKFPNLICRPIGAQFMADDLIALLEFALDKGEPKVDSEKHYRLVPKGDLSEDDLRSYRKL